jgi:hypothetical protein
VPRYLVERLFADGLDIPTNDSGAKAVAAVVATNADHGVTWIHSYVSDDGERTYCICEGPSPEAIRKAASHNRLPVDRITEVRILDPYLRV